MSTPQFTGETPVDAVIHNFGLDLEEEEAFRRFLEEKGFDPDVESLEVLTDLYLQSGAVAHQ